MTLETEINYFYSRNSTSHFLLPSCFFILFFNKVDISILFNIVFTSSALHWPKLSALVSPEVGFRPNARAPRWSWLCSDPSLDYDCSWFIALVSRRYPVNVFIICSAAVYFSLFYLVFCQCNQEFNVINSIYHILIFIPPCFPI